MFRLSKITLILILAGVFCITVPMSGQESLDFQGRLAYERRVDEDTVEVVYYEDGTSNIFSIAATECYRVFREDDEIQSRFLVVSERDNPSFLTVYDMYSTEIVFQRNWETSWGSCSFRWLEGYIGVWIADDTQPDYTDYVRLDTNGDILDTVSAEWGRSRYDETTARLAQWIPDYPSGNGWYDEDYPFWLSRFSPHMVISVWLDDNQNIVQRTSTRRQTVILDTVEGEVIEILENAPILEPTPRFLSGVHIQDFESSYTGEYLFYISRYAMIYDVVADEYLVQIDLDNE